MNADETPRVISRRAELARGLAIAAAVATTVLGLVTTALTPGIVSRSPLLLLALESPVRNMVLARHSPLTAFLVIATLRRTSTAVLFYYLGRWYGEDAVRWLELHAGRAGTAVRTAERFAKFGAYPMVFFLPVPVVSVLAGSMGMRPHTFASISLTGSLCIALTCRWLGVRFAVALDPLLRLFARHGVVATALATAFVVIAVVLRVRGARPATGEPPENRRL